MSVILAATWNPRGELKRLQNLLPMLTETYSHIVISLPPHADQDAVEALEALPDVQAYVNHEWSHGRYMALQLGAESLGTHLHYADMDRLLRWVETQPDEWQHIVAQIPQHDCLVIGRTEQAWATHPHNLRQTEYMTNQTFSHILGQSLDLSAGTKAFSQAAAAFILRNSQAGRALGTDSEWVVLAQRGGFSIESVLVNGLEWETADRFQDVAANPDRQKELAAQSDQDAERWQMRVGVAQEILDCGLEALKRELR